MKSSNPEKNRLAMIRSSIVYCTELIDTQSAEMLVLTSITVGFLLESAWSPKFTLEQLGTVKNRGSDHFYSILFWIWALRST
jgi:hypothetical protein